MSLREILLALFLLSSLGLVVAGIALLLGTGAALIASGVGVGAIGFLLFVEVD